MSTLPISPGDPVAGNSGPGGPLPSAVTLPACDRPATIRWEVYSPTGGTLHGSLDGAVYVCAAHAIDAVTAIELAGLTAYRGTAVMPLDRRCGYAFWYPTARGDQ